MKNIFPAFLILLTIFFITNCKEEKDKDPVCLLTVDIKVIEGDANSKFLVPVTVGGSGNYDYKWNGTYENDTLIVMKSGGLHSPGWYKVRARDFNLGECIAYDSVEVIFSCGNDTIVTDADGNVYQTISIGNQCWMKENLKVTAGVPEITDSAQWVNTISPGWCYYENNSTNFNNCGRLYNWYAVADTNLCPVGWHVPSKAEFDELLNYFGGAAHAGLYLQNPSTFAATQCGSRLAYNAIFETNYDQFWTSTEHDSIRAWGYDTYINNENVSDAVYSKNAGLSIRCIKD